MEVTEIIGQCLKMIGEQDFVAGSASLNDEQIRLRDRLVDCLNFVIREVATNYIHFEITEKVKFLNGEVFCTDLAETYMKAVRLERNGRQETFVTCSDRIKANFDGDADLTYRYIPQAVGLYHSLDDYRLKIDFLVNGVLSYYYFSCGMYDLSEHFEKKFINGVKREIPSIVLPQRRWQ
ncbi:MAG: hypothetical protein ACI4MT_02945 [Christensenellales bacterium]